MSLFADWIKRGTRASQAAAAAANNGQLYFVSDERRMERSSGSAWEDVSSGLIVAVSNVQTGATATGSTLIPFDDTIPQITEGVEFMTLVHTPKKATNKLKIDIVGFFSATASAEWVTQALFQDAVANALASFSTYGGTTNGSMHSGAWSHYMTAGTVSAITFRLRAGTTGGSQVRFNGTGTQRMFGGSLASSITITEIAA